MMVPEQKLKDAVNRRVVDGSLGDSPAFPTELEVRDERTSAFYTVNHLGMTYRQLVAAMALQGLLAFHGNSGPVGDDLYRAALRHADALIAEFEKKP